MAKSSRKRRKERATARIFDLHSRSFRGRVHRAPSADTRAGASARGYARARQGRGRPCLAATASCRGAATAVAVGAVAAGALALANILAVILGWDGGTSDSGQALAGNLLVTGVLVVVAYGMWQAKYWAVLGLRTLLAITMVFASIGLIGGQRVGGAAARHHRRRGRHPVLVHGQGSGAHPDAQAARHVVPRVVSAAMPEGKYDTRVIGSGRAATVAAIRAATG